MVKLKGTEVFDLTFTIAYEVDGSTSSFRIVYVEPHPIHVVQGSLDEAPEGYEDEVDMARERILELVEGVSAETLATWIVQHASSKRLGIS